MRIGSTPPPAWTGSFGCMEETVSTPRLAQRYAEFLLQEAKLKGFDVQTLVDGAPIFPRTGHKPTWDNYTLGLLSRNLKAALSDDFWGLLDDGHMPRGSFRFVCELCALSDNLEAALTRAFRFYTLASNGVGYRLEVQGEVASITMELPGPLSERVGFLYEWWLWLWHYITQWFIGSEIELIRVDFPHRPIADRRDYEEAFGLSCFFESDGARISFPASALRQRIVRTVADVDAMHERTAVSLSYSPNVPRRTRTIVKAALTAQLKQTYAMPTLDQLAVELGICGQTLRRRLQAEGVSYRELKAEVRKEVAWRCINEQGATLSEAATRAGFAEPNGLSRAIRRWTSTERSASDLTIPQASR